MWVFARFGVRCLDIALDVRRPKTQSGVQPPYFKSLLREVLPDA
jgi:hypothetical protein